jgi:hypothetical protein
MTAETQPAGETPTTHPRDLLGGLELRALLGLLLLLLQTKVVGLAQRRARLLAIQRGRRPHQLRLGPRLAAGVVVVVARHSLAIYM